MTTKATETDGQEVAWATCSISRTEYLREQLRLNEWRKHEKSYVECYISSREFIRVIQTSVEDAVKHSGIEDKSRIAVIVFGSCGRLDARVGTSDCDILILYEGEAFDATVAKRQFLESLATRHRALCLDHREVLVAGQLPITHELCYPLLAVSELLAEDSLTSSRRLQILTEGRPVFGVPLFSEVVHMLLRHYGFVDKPASVFPSEIYLRELSDFHCSFWKTIVDGNAASEVYRNRKIAKAILLREPVALTNLYCLLYLTYMKASLHSSQQIYEHLSLPPFAKLYLWMGHEFTTFLSKLSDSTTKWVTGEFLEALQESTRMFVKNVAQSTGSFSVGIVRGLVQDLLRQLNHLLTLLHDPNNLHQIDALDSNYMAWESKDELKELVRARLRFLEAANRLASFLDGVFRRADEDGTLRYPYAGSRLQKQAQSLASFESIYRR